MRPKELVRKCLEKGYDAAYEKKLKKYQIDYHTWVASMEPEAGAECDEDILLLPSEEGEWDQKAKDAFGRLFADHPEVLLAYTDEDVRVADQKSGNPWLKPDWSPDSFLCRDYLGGAVAVRKSLYDKLNDEEKKDPNRCHRRLVELAGGFTKGCKSIRHLEGILFHRKENWQVCEGTTPLELANLTSENLVSIIIPSKDNASVLLQCIETLRHTIVQIPYEVLVIDNGSGSHTRETVEKEVEKLKQDITIAYFYEPMEFNFSRMCNIGAEKAKGNLLLFLNDDIEAVEKGWLETMAQKAKEPWAGAVGVKLCYPDSDRIQHAVITNIGIGPVHKLQFLKDNKCYYDGRNRGIWNCLAVTAACLLVERDKFREVGGFSEELKVAFNDVDFCFNLYEKGYHNIVVNSTHLLHHESLSRGADETEEKVRRLYREREQLYRRHPNLEGVDPYYHSHLNGNGLDTRIVPSYEEGKLFEDKQKFSFFEIPGEAHRDECLLFRVEKAGRKGTQGYMVVLGSDNACFEKHLLFQSKTRPDQVFKVQFLPQMRSDLVENLPDQINVGLSGFQVEFAEKLPPGEYRMGAYARDKISGLQLLNWSNREICI